VTPTATSGIADTRCHRPTLYENRSRRLMVRYEYKDENFLGMAQLGCIVILLRKCL
jgi:hypothetical protein